MVIDKRVEPARRAGSTQLRVYLNCGHTYVPTLPTDEAMQRVVIGMGAFCGDCPRETVPTRSVTIADKPIAYIKAETYTYTLTNRPADGAHGVALKFTADDIRFLRSIRISPNDSPLFDGNRDAVE